jgi:thiamine-phosphate pyrophosphorylase
VIALPRLYAILDIDQAEHRGLAPVVLAQMWLDAGVRLFQLRAKKLTGGPMLDMADALVAVAASASALFIVNDRADVARMAGASGVHLGQDDLTPARVRPMVGDTTLIGLSTHNDQQLDDAQREPVDYLAIGPVFQTRTKANPDPVVGLDGVTRASVRSHRAGVPLVAIGGITLATAPRAIEAGADAVAVVADLLDDDPRARARQFVSALR